MSDKIAHTPGPWQVRHNPLRVAGVQDPEFTRRVCYVGPDTSTTDQEDEANAKLIAAAPKLANRLSLMTQLVKLRFGNTDDLVWQAICDCEELLADIGT